MNRRRFILACAAVASVTGSAALRAQPRVPRIGVLTFANEVEFRPFFQAFRAGMAEHGYQDGKNVRFEHRYSGQNLEALARNARELADAKVDLIWAPATVAVQAAQKATTTIPIVFALVSDPVVFGFVRSLAFPGANLTGISLMAAEMAAKRLEILSEVFPSVRRIGVLSQPGDAASSSHIPHIRKAAAALGKEVLVVDARSPDDFATAFAKLKEWRADALVIPEASLYFFHIKSLIGAATKNRWPTVNSAPQYADAGGVISYGVDYLDNCRRSTEYVDRILKGARPGDLPVQQPTKFDFVINLKAARQIGLTIPPAVLLRADRVIK